MSNGSFETGSLFFFATVAAWQTQIFADLSGNSFWMRLGLCKAWKGGEPKSKDNHIEVVQWPPTICFEQSGREWQ